MRREVGKTRWTVYVCAEPDGEGCVSGTHPNICRHNCAALKRFHESDGRESGPQLAAVEVMPVIEHEDWIGRRHHADCQCGCQFVEGLAGKLVELEVIRVVRFNVPCKPSGETREQLVAYTEYTDYSELADAPAGKARG